MLFPSAPPEKLHRLRALDLGAVHQARVRARVGLAVVHGAAVIPEKHVAEPPDVRPYEFIAAGVLPEEIEKSLALLFFHAVDVLGGIGPPAAEIERLSA